MSITRLRPTATSNWRAILRFGKQWTTSVLFLRMPSPTLTIPYTHGIKLILLGLCHGQGSSGHLFEKNSTRLIWRRAAIIKDRNKMLNIILKCRGIVGETAHRVGQVLWIKSKMFACTLSANYDSWLSSETHLPLYIFIVIPMLIMRFFGRSSNKFCILCSTYPEQDLSGAQRASSQGLVDLLFRANFCDNRKKLQVFSGATFDC